MQINTLLKAMVSGSINIYIYSIYPNKITGYLSWVFATQLGPAIGSWDILEAKTRNAEHLGVPQKKTMGIFTREKLMAPL